MKKPRAIPKVKNPESQGFRENPGNKNPEIKKILILKKIQNPRDKNPETKKIPESRGFASDRLLFKMFIQN